MMPKLLFWLVQNLHYGFTCWWARWVELSNSIISLICFKLFCQNRYSPFDKPFWQTFCFSGSHPWQISIKRNKSFLKYCLIIAALLLVISTWPVGYLTLVPWLISCAKSEMMTGFSWFCIQDEHAWAGAEVHGNGVKFVKQRLRNVTALICFRFLCKSLA